MQQNVHKCSLSEDRVSEILEVLISAETELKSYGHSYATLLLSPYDLCGIKF